MYGFSYVTYIKIYDEGIKTMAEVTHEFGKDIEIIDWNYIADRERVLKCINGYTFIEDTRIKE